MVTARNVYLALYFMTTANEPQELCGRRPRGGTYRFCIKHFILRSEIQTWRQWKTLILYLSSLMQWENSVMEIMHRRWTLNYIFINVWSLSAAPYWLKAN